MLCPTQCQMSFKKGQTNSLGAGWLVDRLESISWAVADPWNVQATQSQIEALSGDRLLGAT